MMISGSDQPVVYIPPLDSSRPFVHAGTTCRRAQLPSHRCDKYARRLQTCSATVPRGRVQQRDSRSTGTPPSGSQGHRVTAAQTPTLLPSKPENNVLGGPEGKDGNDEGRHREASHHQDPEDVEALDPPRGTPILLALPMVALYTVRDRSAHVLDNLAELLEGIPLPAVGAAAGPPRKVHVELLVVHSTRGRYVVGLEHWLLVSTLHADVALLLLDMTPRKLLIGYQGLPMLLLCARRCLIPLPRPSSSILNVLCNALRCECKGYHKKNGTTPYASCTQCCQSPPHERPSHLQSRQPPPEEVSRPACPGLPLFQLSILFHVAVKLNKPFVIPPREQVAIRNHRCCSYGYLPLLSLPSSPTPRRGSGISK